MERTIIPLAAFLGSLLVYLLNWLSNRTPFDHRDFVSSMIRSLLAAAVFAFKYDLFGPLDGKAVLYALLSGAGINGLVNGAGHLLGYQAFPFKHLEFHAPPDAWCDYRLKVMEDHKHGVKRIWFFSYQWWWYHTEIWIVPEHRRPYTYILRDLFFPHMGVFWTLSGIWFATWLGLTFWDPNDILRITGVLLVMASALVWAHLRWGSVWIPGEMT